MASQPETNQKKKMSKGKKIALWVVGGFVGLIVFFTVLGGILNAVDPEGMEQIRNEQEAERNAKASQKAAEDAARESAKAEDEAAKAKAQAKTEQEAQASQKAEDEKRAAEESAKNDPMRLIAEASGVEGIVVTQKGGRITADFPIADNLSMRMIQRGAQNDTVAILKAVSEHAPAKYEEVLVLGGMDMQDAYGQVTEGQKVLQAEYSKETIGKINYENVFPESIWELRDFGLIHKVLRETE